MRILIVTLLLAAIGGCTDMSEKESTSVLSPEAQAIKKTITKDQLRLDMPIEEKRQSWEDAVLQMPLPSGVELTADTMNGVPVLWVRTEETSGEQLIIYIHGGGLVEGSATTTRELAARLAKGTSMPVLVVDYRLAPEFPFPAALNDVKAVYRELLTQYAPENLVMGGDSNGGGLALASLVDLRDERQPMPGAAFLLSPAADLSFSGESMRTRAEVDPFTSEEVLRYCARLYAGEEDVLNPLISPLFADLSGLPPMLIQVGDHEILLSDAGRLAERLDEVELSIWPEMWHAWHYYPDLPEAAAAIKEIGEFLVRVLMPEG